MKKIRKEGILEDIDPASQKEDPLALPPGFEWSQIDNEDDAQVEEIANFLSEHYVESTNGDFRLHYSKEFLQYVFQVPGSEKKY
mmetsp:Transcript_39623/g.60666  ORF Transcript_39623/g.60666 Transcript_39623/m.60666 type:complete len:84 (+) Transcript_39623:229-480(+)